MATNVNLLDYAPGALIRALDYIVTPWENLDGLNRPLWHDLSSNQGKSNIGILVANDAYGFAFRAGISYGYPDPMFPDYWAQAGAFDGVYRTSYHVPYTDQPLLAQLDNHWYRLHPEPDKNNPIPRVLDLEVARPDSYAHKADFVWQASEKIKERDGMSPWIYSRKNILDAWLASWTLEMKNAHLYWLAQYTWDRIREHPGDPALPNGVRRENVILHQTADKKAPPPGAVQSYALDYDRWELGDAAYMRKFLVDNYGGGDADEGPFPVVPALRFKVTAPFLNVRSGPGTNFAIIGGLQVGDIITVKNIAGSSAWVEFDGGFAAVEYGTARFMEPVV